MFGTSLYGCTIIGTAPLIMHSGERGLDTRSKWNLRKGEITKKRGANRTDTDDAELRELETITSFWIGEDGMPTIPEGAFRACIEAAARKFKDGPLVREGLIVKKTNAFHWDRETYGDTLDELKVSTQFTVPVVVQRARIMRTRAMFNVPWSCDFTLECEDDLIDERMITKWLEIAGRRIGIGDWRPATSGQHGRFESQVERIED